MKGRSRKKKPANIDIKAVLIQIAVTIISGLALKVIVRLLGLE